MVPHAPARSAFASIERSSREVPLVHGDHDAPARLLHVAADGRVHLAQPLGRVEHQDRHVAALDGAARLHDAHVVDVLLQQPHAPDAGGVHEAGSACRPARAGCPRRRAWCRGWPRPPRARAPSSRFSSDDLPTLGRPTSASRRGGSASSRRLDLGQAVERRVEQVAHAQAVLGRDGRASGRSRGGANSGDAVVVALDLVHGDDHPLAAPPQLARRWLRRRAAGRPGRRRRAARRSASSMARLACSAAGPRSGSSVPRSRPPVSISSKAAPCQVTCA